MIKQSDKFSFLGKQLDYSAIDFWKWAYSDTQNNISRSAIAEFIVATAIGATTLPRIMWQPYDLLSPNGYRIEVKSAAYVQSWDCKHPDHVSYSIAPARVQDADGNYKNNAPKQRNSDAYVFCLYKATSPEQSPFCLDLWDFFVISTKILDAKKPLQKSITLPSLMLLEPFQCDYLGITSALSHALAP